MAKVLIVNSDHSLSMTLGLALTARGHIVQVETDGLDAIDMGLRFRPNVLLTDLELDGPLDGLQVVAALRAVRHELHSMLTSSLPLEELLRIGQDAQLAAYFDKPLYLERVCVAIEKVSRTHGMAPPVSLAYVEYVLNGRLVYANTPARKLLRLPDLALVSRQLTDVFDELEKFLQDVTSEDNEVRSAARRQAGQVGSAAVTHLGKLMVDGRREIAITARAALDVIVHDAAHPDTPGKAKIVAAELAKLLRPDAALTVKREVLHLIAFIGGDEVVAAVAARLSDDDRHVREAARLALADPELKITALDLQDQLLKCGLETTYLDVARTGSASVRPTALKGYLVLARDRLENASQVRKEAAAMFVRALSLAPDEGQRIEAIQGLDAVGEPGVVETLVPYLSDPAVGAEASQAFVNLSEKLVDRGELDAAEPLLLRILSGQFPHALKVRTADKLTAAGRDPQTPVRAQGFVLDWWLIGPIHTDGRNPFEVKFFPEEKREFEGIHNIGARRYRWQRPRLLTTTREIDLLPLFRRSQRRVAYAYAELRSPGEQETLFKMGSVGPHITRLVVSILLVGSIAWFGSQSRHGARLGRESMRLASGSLMHRSFSESQ